MFDNLKADYIRYGGKRGNLLTFGLKFFADAGFRAVLLYRMAYWCRKHHCRPLAMILDRLMHHLCYCWITSSAEIGPGFYIAHVGGLVIGGKTIIGKNCDVRQNITLGGNFNKVDSQGRTQPVLEDNISVGVGAVIIGPVEIGSNTIIGANAVVTKDMPENVIVAGNPARVIKPRWNEDSGRKL